VPLDDITRRGVRDRPDVAGLASLDQNKLCIMVWHYHDDDVPGPDAEVQLRLGNIPPRAGELRVRQFRIDQKHSNAYTAWQRMGSPLQPTPERYLQLQKAGELAELTDPVVVTDEGSTVSLSFELPRQGVSLLQVTW
jgi:xylan 1,4-beta-xylosidase